MSTAREPGYYWVRSNSGQWEIVLLAKMPDNYGGNLVLYAFAVPGPLDPFTFDVIAEWGPRIECPAGYLREFRGDSARSAHLYAAEAEHQSLGPHSVVPTAELDALRKAIASGTAPSPLT